MLIVTEVLDVRYPNTGDRLHLRSLRDSEDPAIGALCFLVERTPAHGDKAVSLISAAEATRLFDALGVAWCAQPLT